MTIKQAIERTIERKTNKVKSLSDSDLLDFLEIYSNRMMDYDDPEPAKNAETLAIIGLEMARRLTEKSGRLDLATGRSDTSE